MSSTHDVVDTTDPTPVDGTFQVSDLRVDIVRTPEAMEELAPHWDRLLAASHTNNIFLTWAWISTWWRVYAGTSRLHVMVVRGPDGTIVGLAPLKRARINPFGGDTVTFIGAGSDVRPEYLDFIVRAGLEAPVLGIVLRELLGDPTISEIDLQPVASDSANIAHVAAVLAEGPGILRRRSGAVCPFFTLPASIEQFRSSRSRNYRKKLGEFERRCDRGLTARLRVSRTPAEVSRDLATLKGLHGTRWGGRSRAFRSKEYVEFHERFARLALDREWLRLYSLEAGATPVAILYCFLYDGRYYFYQSGRDPQFSRQRAGLVLMHKVIQEAIREEASVFDFLSGDEPYKNRWATGKRLGYRITYWKSARVWAISQCRQGLATMVRMPDRLISPRPD